MEVKRIWLEEGDVCFRIRCARPQSDLGAGDALELSRILMRLECGRWLLDISQAIETMVKGIRRTFPSLED